MLTWALALWNLRPHFHWTFLTDIYWCQYEPPSLTPREVFSFRFRLDWSFSLADWDSWSGRRTRGVRALGVPGRGLGVSPVSWTSCRQWKVPGSLRPASQSTGGAVLSETEGIPGAVRTSQAAPGPPGLLTHWLTSWEESEADLRSPGLRGGAGNTPGRSRSSRIQSGSPAEWRPLIGPDPYRYCALISWDHDASLMS